MRGENATDADSLLAAVIDGTPDVCGRRGYNADDMIACVDVDCAAPPLLLGTGLVTAVRPPGSASFAAARFCRYEKSPITNVADLSAWQVAATLVRE